MSSVINDKEGMARSIIIYSQHLNQRSSKSVEDIVSDICGLQYDPNPTIHLNQYMMLWNRKKDFTINELDVAAYKDFRVVETIAFKRNLFFVPYNEFAFYRAATKRIERWGTSEERLQMSANNPLDQAAEKELKNGLKGLPGMSAKQIWAHFNLSYEWKEYLKGRSENNRRCELPIFHAFFRLVRRSELLTCGRNSGTFREPIFILKENVGMGDWPNKEVDDQQAKSYIIEKLISSLGVTDPIHVSHISGIPTTDIAPIFAQLENEKIILPFPFKIGKKTHYIHSSRAHLVDNLGYKSTYENSEEVRLISPMDTLVRDKKWLETFFDYSFSFEYFKKKGMKWPLSILVGNRFVGYLDCKMEWRTKKFIIKERNIFDSAFNDHKGIEHAVQDLAAFHGAKEITEKRCWS